MSTALVGCGGGTRNATGCPANNAHSTPLMTNKYDRVTLGFGKVHKGMTEEQVRAAIGQPSSTNRFGWTWRFTHVGTADEEVYVVFFTNRIVADMNHVKTYFTSEGKTNAEPAAGHVR